MFNNIFGASIIEEVMFQLKNRKNNFINLIIFATNL